MYYSGAPFAFKENKNVRSLLAYISKKGFSVGNKLPPERELAEQLGISRNSLREALKVLEAMDVVEIRHGSGIFLRKEDTQPDDGSSLWLMIHKDEILNILTVREALDLKAIDLIPRGGLPPSPGRDESVYRRRAQNGHDERGHAPPRPRIPQHHPPRRQQ